MHTFDSDAESVAGTTHRVKGEESAAHLQAQRTLESGDTRAVDRPLLMHLQRTAGNAGANALLAQRDEADGSESESPVKDVVRSSGQPLSADVRADMEGRLGHDFSDVQVHTDTGAADSAKSVQAHAYTVGSHVVFDAGKYQPDSSDGRRMLAHELTHVVQQRSGPVDGSPAAGGINLSHPSDRFEQEAERSADLAVSSAAPADVGGGAGAAVQRAGADEEEETAQGSFVQRAPAAGEEEKEDETAQGSFLQRAAAAGAGPAPGEEEMEETAQGSFVQRAAAGPAPEEEVPEEAAG